MFRFQISNYDAPALEAETAELLSQRREKASRQNFPGLWRLTDRFYAHAAKGPGRESRRKAYHAYGYFLLALGAFAIMLGLMEPGIPALVAAGVFAVACGILEFLLVRKRRPLRVPWMASCQKDAKALLDGKQAYDWAASGAVVTFDDDGMAISAGEDRLVFVSFDRLRDVFETERLFLVIYDDNSAILLQKKDLVEGDAAELVPFLRRLNNE